jgi:hypothetical protein
MPTSGIHPPNRAPYATNPAHANTGNRVFGLFLSLGRANNLVREQLEANHDQSHPIAFPQLPPTPQCRYFIMKCLSHQEIEWSRRNKLWITQKHNETVLNDAIKAHTHCKDD